MIGGHFRGKVILKQNVRKLAKGIKIVTMLQCQRQENVTWLSFVARKLVQGGQDIKEVNTLSFIGYIT